MNPSMPGLPVHHQLLEFTQTHVHRVSDAIQPSHPLSSPSPPAPNPSQHQSLFPVSQLFAWGGQSTSGILKNKKKRQELAFFPLLLLPCNHSCLSSRGLHFSLLSLQCNYCCLSLGGLHLSPLPFGEGNGTPLQYSCLENPMDGGAWWAAVHGVTRSRTRLSDFTFTFHFHVLEKEMATHSSVLAWRIPGTGEPGGLLSMGSHRVGHDWSDLAAAAASTFAM